MQVHGSERQREAVRAGDSLLCRSRASPPLTASASPSAALDNRQHADDQAPFPRNGSSQAAPEADWDLVTLRVLLAPEQAGDQAGARREPTSGVVPSLFCPSMAPGSLF